MPQFGGMLAGAAALALVVGTATAEAKTEVRVTVAYYSDQTEGIFKGMANDFMKAHPDIDIKLEDVQWDNLQQRLTTDIAGGTAPDIAIIGTRWLVDYVKNDIAEPLDSYMTPEFKGRFIETFLPPSTIDGKTLRPAGRGLGARHVLQQGRCSQKAGVTEPPKTWDELEADAKKVKAAGRRLLRLRASRARRSRPTPTGTTRSGPRAASC